MEKHTLHYWYQETNIDVNTQMVKVDDIIKEIIPILDLPLTKSQDRYLLEKFYNELSQSNPEMSLKRTGEEETPQSRGLRVDSGNDTLKCECGDLRLNHICSKKRCRRCCQDRCLKVMVG
jgi:hypothetical protein